MFSRKAVHGGAVPGDSRVHGMGRSAGYVVDAEQRLVVVKLGKKVTFKDIERLFAGVADESWVRAQFFRDRGPDRVEELYLQADEFLKLADEIDPFSPIAKRAFGARTAVQSHAARMHKILRVQGNIEIFHSVEDAERWIRA